MISFTFTVQGYAQPWKRQGGAGKFRWSDSRKMKDHKGLIAMKAREAMCDRCVGIMDGSVGINIWIVRKIPKSWSRKKNLSASSGGIRPTTRPDLDNQFKLILDALNGIAWVDDSQVCDFHVQAIYSNSDYTKIEIIELDLQS